jgi:hypothetical protein
MAPQSTDPDERRVRALADGLRRAIAAGMADEDLGALARAVLDNPHEDETEQAGEDEELSSD